MKRFRPVAHPGPLESHRNPSPPAIPRGSWIDGAGYQQMLDELTGLVAFAGFTPTDADPKQIFRAARRMGGAYYAGAGTQGTVGGTANAITLTTTVTPIVIDTGVEFTRPPITADDLPGLRLTILATATNTGAVTLAVDGQPAVAVERPNGDALRPGDIVANKPFELIRVGSVWVMMSTPVAWGVERALRVTNATASTSLNLLAETRWLDFTMIGAGASGTVWDNTNSGPGGGAGATVRGRLARNEVTSPLVLTIGSGGLGLAAGAAFRNGNAGGHTTLPTIHGTITAGGAPQPLWNAINSGGTATVPAALVGRVEAISGPANYGGTWIGGLSYDIPYGMGGNGAGQLAASGHAGRIMITEFA